MPEGGGFCINREVGCVVHTMSKDVPPFEIATEIPKCAASWFKGLCLCKAETCLDYVS